jgi:hypothetical protein
MFARGGAEDAEKKGVKRRRPHRLTPNIMMIGMAVPPGMLFASSAPLRANSLLLRASAPPHEKGLLENPNERRS